MLVCVSVFVRWLPEQPFLLTMNSLTLAFEGSCVNSCVCVPELVCMHAHASMSVKAALRLSRSSIIDKACVSRQHQCVDKYNGCMRERDSVCFWAAALDCYTFSAVYTSGA